MRLDLQIYKPITGLFNQICSLIYGIMIAKQQKKKIVIVNNFMREIRKPNMIVPVSKVINLEETNKNLKENFDIILLDANNIQLKIDKVEYIDIEKNINVDITEHIKQNFKKGNRIFIGKNTNFHKLMNRKDISINQKIVINLNINKYKFTREFLINQGYNKMDIIIDYSNFNFVFMFEFPNKNTENFYKKCFNCFVFYDRYFVNIEKLIEHKYEKINLCHLRIENDALEHWSKMNNLSINDFKLKIENTYIHFIKKYFGKNHLNIILSYSVQNKVIQFLKNNNYDFFVLKKNLEEGREINALKDFLLGKYCNNVFIGAHGSSFSWGLNIVTNPNTKVFINLNNINHTKEMNHLKENIEKLESSLLTTKEDEKLESSKEENSEYVEEGLHNNNINNNNNDSDIIINNDNGIMINNDIINKDNNEVIGSIYLENDNISSSKLKINIEEELKKNKKTEPIIKPNIQKQNVPKTKTKLNKKIKLKLKQLSINNGKPCTKCMKKLMIRKNK